MLAVVGQPRRAPGSERARRLFVRRPCVARGLAGVVLSELDLRRRRRARAPPRRRPARRARCSASCGRCGGERARAWRAAARRAGSSMAGRGWPPVPLLGPARAARQASPSSAGPAPGRAALDRAFAAQLPARRPADLGQRTRGRGRASSIPVDAPATATCSVARRRGPAGDREPVRTQLRAGLAQDSSFCLRRARDRLPSGSGSSPSTRPGRPRRDQGAPTTRAAVLARRRYASFGLAVDAWLPFDEKRARAPVRPEARR